MLQLLFLSSKRGLPLAVSEVTVVGAQANRKELLGVSVLAAAALGAAVLRCLPL